MMMRVSWLFPALVAFGSVVSFTAYAGISTSGFERVPAGALIALAETRGRPFRSGLVIVNGHYLKPPYVVSRYGTALAVNGVQVTGPLVAWSTFLATQPGGGDAAATGPAGKAAEPEKADNPAPAPQSSIAASADDLFEDDEDDPQPSPAAASAVAPQAPAAAVVKFVPNFRSNALLARLNAMRTDLDRSLRNGQFFFFGSRYARVNGPYRTAMELLSVLPEAMRDAEDGADLNRILRAAGVTYIGPDVCDDLMENRIDYLALSDRRRQLRQEAETLRLLHSGNGAL